MTHRQRATWLPRIASAPASEDSQHEMLRVGMSDAEVQTMAEHDDLDAVAFGLLGSWRDTDGAGADRLLSSLRRNLFAGDTEQRIGRYVILEELGAGGMGVVYRAHDPELGRDVAVKVLHARHAAAGSPTDEDSALAGLRILREAQALARVEHPNVVRVFDVGTHEQAPGVRSIYLVMELVRGESLAVWLLARRPWREVARAFVQAARGLAAVHARGIVHRDFKPGNAIIDGAGVVRVLDFGLARSGLSADEESSTGRLATRPGNTLTRSDCVVGTPAYMAPEQHRRGHFDERADQFALCVSLYEGLWGERPYRQHEITELAAAKRARDLQIPDVAAVPEALVAVVLRGLAADPSARFVDMTQLADALERTTRRRVPWVPAFAALAVIAIGTGVWRGGAEQRAAQACEQGGEALTAWDDAVTERIELAFARTGVRYAGTATPLVIAGLREHRDAIASTWREVCGQAAPALPEQRACLETRLVERNALADELARADAHVVTESVDAVDRLTDPTTCRTPPPNQTRSDDPVQLELRREYEALNQSFITGHRAAVREAIPELARRVEAAGDRQLLGKVRLLLADSELDGGDPRRAEAALEAAALDAQAAGDDNAAAEAWFFLAYQLAQHQGRSDDARRMLRHGEAALAKLGDDIPRERDAWVARGTIAIVAGDYPAALDAAERSRELGVQLWGEGDWRLAKEDSHVAVALRRMGRVEESIATLRMAIEKVERQRGTEYPLLVMLRGNLGTALIEQGELDAALHEYRTVLALLDGYGETHSSQRALLLQHIAEALLQQRNYAEARDVAREALAILETQGQADQSLGAQVRDVIGRALGGVGDHEAALRQHELALDIYLRLDSNARWLPGTHRYIAGEAAEVGRFQLAVQHGELAVERATRIYGASHLETARSLYALGRALLRSGRFAEATQSLTQAQLLADEVGGSLGFRAWVALQLARARAETGTSRAELDPALATMLDELREAARPDVEVIGELEEWLGTAAR